MSSVPSQMPGCTPGRKPALFMADSIGVFFQVSEDRWRGPHQWYRPPCRKSLRQRGRRSPGRQRDGIDPKSYAGGGAYPGDAFPGWPVAGTNHWEVRDYYVIDLLALPKLSNYCYSHRAFYVEKQTYYAAMAGAEAYDRTGKLYKMLWFHCITISGSYFKTLLAIRFIQSA